MRSLIFYFICSAVCLYIIKRTDLCSAAYWFYFAGGIVAIIGTAIDSYYDEKWREQKSREDKGFGW